ncbi:MAG TPA: universal stress protein [Desulfonauticus sp.]|jgi:nucleotide-binding universal stress UspA family protein|nr:MAG: Uncharacterized protein XD41_0833 [Desulfonauticus sp. 38_4375]MDK2922051.1 hypothetical protein [Desulfonauticus sp.]HCO12519.1 universal stress protein [Desulfonauticus sp.]
MFNRILLATHGTLGAQKAEDFVLKYLQEDNSVELVILSIINKDWQFMMGDDWLNTSATRNKFASYVEQEINEEIDLLWQRLKNKFKSFKVNYTRKVGSLEEAIKEAALENKVEAIVIGSRQKKRSPGFKARLDYKKLQDNLPCPLIIIPG